MQARVLLTVGGFSAHAHVSSLRRPSPVSTRAQPVRSGRFASPTVAAAKGTFQDLERDAWCAESVATAYTSGWEVLTTQSVQPMLQAARVSPGSKVLDVCTGPGLAALGACVLGADAVVGLDFSEAFCAQCRERCQEQPQVAVVCGDAQQFPSEVAERGPYDAVVCNFGVLHLARPEAFLAEAFAACAPGGRVAFTVWMAPPKTAVFDALLRSVREHGDPDAPLPEGPPFFQFANKATAAAKLEAAGFEDAMLVENPQWLEVDSAAEVWAMLSEGTARTRALLNAQEPAALERVRAAMEAELVASYSTSKGSLRIPMPSALASATRPK